MFKTVVAVPGQYVELDDTGVRVDGRPIPHSAALKVPAVLPRLMWHGTLGADQYWVWGSGARPDLADRSFDSRYYGPIARREIRGAAVR